MNDLKQAKPEIEAVWREIRYQRELYAIWRYKPGHAFIWPREIRRPPPGMPMMHFEPPSTPGPPNIRPRQ